MARPKKQVTKNILYRAEGISVYMRPTERGTKRLYLDIRVSNKRHYDFKATKGLELNGNAVHDAEVLALVKEIVAKKQIEIAATKHGIVAPFKSKINFVQYFEQITEQHAKRGINQGKPYKSTLKHLQTFAGKTLLFEDITEHWLVKFQAYLQERVSDNSVSSYMAKIAAVLAKAVTAKIIPVNPVKFLDRSQKVQRKSSNRIFLTFAEIQTLAETPCKKPEIARMFLFACWTGLRVGDIRALQWRNITPDGELEIVQQKTNYPLSVPLGETARELLGERPPTAKATDFVFERHSEDVILKTLKTWAKAAHLDKADRINFHTARHTFATLGLTSGVELKIVSAMLGHRNVRTTEIYAKVVSESKWKAIEKLPRVVLASDVRKAS